MNKREKEWVDWFMDRFETETRYNSDSSLEDRVPWEQIEEKGIELKIVKTSEHGWFDKLRSIWAELMPKRWCREAERAIELRLPVTRLGEKQKHQRHTPITPQQRFDRWGDHNRRFNW